MLLLDRLGDHGRIGRQRTRVVGDEQRSPIGRDVLDALDSHAEPVPVEELHQGAIERALHSLGAAPIADLALGLEAGQEVAQIFAPGREPGPVALPAALEHVGAGVGLAFAKGRTPVGSHGR